MAFNAKTYPYTEYLELIQLMDQAVTKLGESEGPLYIPVGSKEQTLAVQHTCHRIRAAIRVQEAANKMQCRRYDPLLLQIVELEGEKPYGLKVTGRGSALGELNLKIYDASGKEV